ncbi:hypothetical protein ES703_125086 [subsurface metagenome]
MDYGKRPPLDEQKSLWQATIAAESVTTDAGEVTGLSLDDVGLAGAGLNSFISMLAVIHPGDPTRVDSKDITGFNNVTGRVTVASAFKGGQVLAGVPYKIVTFRFVPAEVAAIEGKLDERIVMERFEDYYGGADDLSPVGPALLDRVIFQVIPEDSTRVAALQAGEVDIIQGVQAHMISILEADPNISVKTCGGTRPFWMEMNPNKPPFNDVQVRHALNYAVNVDLLIEKVLGGRGVALPGALSPFNNFADATLKPYGYDPDKAKALLAEAGWTDTDGDGILDKDGQPFAFVIDAVARQKDRAEAVMGQLREIGIRASVRVWDYAVLKPLLLNGDRMAYVGDWGDSAFDPVGHFEAKWHTHIKGSPYGRGNFSSYSNPRVDELIERGEVTSDVARRHKIYDEAQRIIYEEAPAIFIFLPEEVEACSVRVRNWEPSPDSRLVAMVSVRHSPRLVR